MARALATMYSARLLVRFYDTFRVQRERYRNDRRRGELNPAELKESPGNDRRVPQTAAARTNSVIFIHIEARTVHGVFNPLIGSLFLDPIKKQRSRFLSPSFHFVPLCFFFFFRWKKIYIERIISALIARAAGIIVELY